MSLSSILSIARSALMAHQRSMNVTANNIANSRTPGYTRQRLFLEAIGSQSHDGAGTLGGVLGRGVERLRDPFLDSSYRSEAALLGESATTRYYLEQVEAAVDEPSESGVASALDALFQAFGDLATDPMSSVSREEVQRAAERLTHRLKRLSTSINDSMEQAAERMQWQVQEVNSIVREIATLNEKIASSPGGASTSPELLDQRDRLVDQLSELVSVRTEESADGTLTVMSAGLTLVSGGAHQDIALKSLEGGGFGLGPAAGDEVVNPQSGSLKALSDLTTLTLPDMSRRLDLLAQAVVTEVNALHRTGYNALGQTNIDFFDPAGITAATISLSSNVLESPDAIAAGLTAEVGDNTLALELAALAGQDIDMLGDRTFTTYYSSFVASVGGEVRDAVQSEQSSRTLLDNASTIRSSVGGVSVDEEMVNLITQQEAYTAAARLVTVANQMLEEILQMGR